MRAVAVELVITKTKSPSTFTVAAVYTSTSLVVEGTWVTIPVKVLPDPITSTLLLM